MEGKKVYYDDDASIEILKGKKVCILGYGSQGRAHARNLADSGVDVVVGLRSGSKSAGVVEADGLKWAEMAEAVEGAALVAMLVPDPAQPELYREVVAPRLGEGTCLLFAHGFNIHYGQILPPEGVDVVMVAPKGPGRLVRELYEKGQGVPALVAVARDATGRALETALGYAKGLGCTRAGVIPTTFKEETETDLFGEQAVLCGGLTALLKAGFETLVEAGYSPEAAYFECVNEMKLIVDLVYRGGLKLMRRFISDTAKYGDITRGPRIIDEHVRANMREILAEIQDGRFAREWVLENAAGRPVMRALLAKDEAHPMEEVGARLREMMKGLGEE